MAVGHQVGRLRPVPPVTAAGRRRRGTALVDAGVSGYSGSGMKQPRNAHLLAAWALALGTMGAPVARAHGAPRAAKAPRAEVEGSPRSTPEEPGEAATGKAAPTDEPTPTGKATPTGEAPPTGKATPTGKAPTGEPTPVEPTPTDETEPTPVEPTSEPTPVEPTPTPTITVTPRPVAGTGAESPALPPAVPPRETALDPRRRAGDERILVRAGVLAFGVAGAALVPTVVGLHQAAYARRVLGRLDTPSEASGRPDVEAYERSMTRMAVASAGVAVSGIVAGVLLVSLGSRRGRSTPPAAVAPAVGPGTAGVVLRGRF